MDFDQPPAVILMASELASQLGKYADRNVRVLGRCGCGRGGGGGVVAHEKRFHSIVSYDPAADVAILGHEGQSVSCRWARGHKHTYNHSAA